MLGASAKGKENIVFSREGSVRVCVCVCVCGFWAGGEEEGKSRRNSNLAYKEK